MFKGLLRTSSPRVALYKRAKVFVRRYDGRLVASTPCPGKKVLGKTHHRSLAFLHRHGRSAVVKAMSIGERLREYVRARLLSHRPMMRVIPGLPGMALVRVPGDPVSPFEDSSMAAAARPGTPLQWGCVVNGGGGTPWDTITYYHAIGQHYLTRQPQWFCQDRNPAKSLPAATSSILLRLVALNRNPENMPCLPMNARLQLGTTPIERHPMILADIRRRETTQVIQHRQNDSFAY